MGFWHFVEAVSGRPRAEIQARVMEVSREMIGTYVCVCQCPKWKHKDGAGKCIACPDCNAFVPMTPTAPGK